MTAQWVHISMGHDFASAPEMASQWAHNSVSRICTSATDLGARPSATDHGARHGMAAQRIYISMIQFSPREIEVVPSGCAPP